MGFAGPFVFIEPSPYEIATLLATVVFFATGMRMRLVFMPLLLALFLLNVGYTIAAVPVMDRPNVANWIATSWYMAVTVVFFAMVLSEDTQARLGVHPFAQDRIRFQTRHDRRPVRVQVKHRANSLDDEKQRTGVAELHPKHERIVLRLKGKVDKSMASLHGNGATIFAGLDRLDSRCGACRKKLQHAIPMVGRPKTKPEDILIFRLQAGQAGKASNLGGRSLVNLANRSVETAGASEARSEGDLAHRQLRLIDKLFREVQTARLGYGTGRRSQMLDEQAAEMAGAHSQAFCKAFQAAVLQATFGDQTQCPGHRVRSSQPSGSAR